MCTLPNRTSLPGPVAYLHQRGTRRKSLNTRFRAGKWQKTHTLRAVRERRRARRARARGGSENVRPVRRVGFRLLEDACRHRDHADASRLGRTRIARAQVVSSIWSRQGRCPPSEHAASRCWCGAKVGRRHCGQTEERALSCVRGRACGRGGRDGASPARVCGDTRLLQGRYRSSTGRLSSHVCTARTCQAPTTREAAGLPRQPHRAPPFWLWGESSAPALPQSASRSRSLDAS